MADPPPNGPGAPDRSPPPPSLHHVPRPTPFLHHLVEGTREPGTLEPGTPEPAPPVPRPPVGERSPRQTSDPAAVHSPSGHGASGHSPSGHSPSGQSASGRPGSGRESTGASPGNRVVLVHGFSQTLASWGPVGERLAGRWEVVRVDLPGHGASGGIRVGFAEAAGLVGACGGRGAYVGYSLGGRLCLRLALDRPDLVRALVLIGASPGIADPVVRAERRAADEALAGGIERDGVAAFLDRWLADPLFATLPAEAAGRADRLVNTADGLASALRLLGTGSQEPLWDRLGGLRPPTLLVAGALDSRFAAMAAEMAAAIGPGARVALVPGAGHAAHLERSAEVATLVAEFLTATLGGGSRGTSGAGARAGRGRSDPAEPEDPSN